MNALVKKEIRLLLPGFLIASALTAPNLFVEPHEYGMLRLLLLSSFVFCPAMVVWMALNSFGAEISSGTFSMLLAQPVSRQRIWRTKVFLLATALFIVCVLWCVFLYPGPADLKKSGMDLPEIYLWAWLLLLAIYSGALWTVLLLRQVAAAFWFTFLLPLTIIVSVDALAWTTDTGLIKGLTGIALVIYSIAGFFFARWLFLRAEDVQWTGGTLSLPEMQTGSRFWRRRADKRFWRPKAALLLKEIQLHQSQFVIAIALAVAHLGVIAMRKFGNFRKNSMLEFVLESFWGLWLVLPMLVGAAAVAEERKLGTLAAQLCQPIRRHTQFAIKLCVALVLSLLFGVGMPLLLEGSHLELLAYMNSSRPLLAFGVAAAIGGISFFASTLARNTLQAIASAILAVVIGGILLGTAWHPGYFLTYSLWNGALIYFISIPIFGLVLLGMSFWNFQRLNVGGQTLRRNLLVLGVSLVFIGVVTTAIYHRVWERFTPIEPPHGPAQLSLAHPPTLASDWRMLSIHMPNGDIWTADYEFHDPSRFGSFALSGDFGISLRDPGFFYKGSNWTEVVRGPRGQRIGIKADGTLWLSEKWTSGEPIMAGRGNRLGALIRYGAETNWRSAGGYGSFVLLVKNDGTLWEWGTNRFDKHWPGLQSFTPHRLGKESDWTQVISRDNQVWLRKKDGSTWSPKEDASEFSAKPTTIDFFRKGLNWATLNRCKIGVAEDGTLRIWADLRPSKSAHAYTYNYTWTQTDLTMGHGTNWLNVAGVERRIVTLKDDGSLWLWTFPYNPWNFANPDLDEQKMRETEPVRLGTHSDWISITTAPGGVTTLAADGSLWYWPLIDAADMNEMDGLVPLLDISRKPQLLANIFSN